MISIAAIKSAPTTFSATATTTASARVRISRSRSGFRPAEWARSSFSVEVSSACQRQTRSATTTAAPPQIRPRSAVVTARISPKR